MKDRYLKASTLAIITVISLSLLPLGKTQSETQGYTSSFLLLNQPEGKLAYELNITIPPALYQYYVTQNHATYSVQDLSKFVTPTALKPIADRLWQIYNNTEDFTNGVLMLVHQITYKEVVPGKYPIETLVGGKGDCDLFAYIAASILKAGGIPTVLIYYKNQLHMEIGVDLGTAPTKARVDVYSVNYNNVPYYIGECTGEQWRDGWRIGEIPSKYQNVSSQVVSLQNTAQLSIGQVSASLRELSPSDLALQISLPIMFESSNVIISGQILPQTANENVTLKAKINSDSWTTIGTVETQEDGRFEYNWVPITEGVITVQASWQGNRQYNGATSAERNIIVLPMLIVVLVVALVLAVVIFAFVAVRVIFKKPAQSTQPKETVFPS
jgi:hypothetical protein